MSLPTTMRLADLRFPEEGAETEVRSGQSCVHDAVADEALLSLISDGQQEALASLFRRYARTVRVVALRVLKDPAEAEDLLQDIFVLIHRLSGKFDSSKTSAQLRSWPSTLVKGRFLPPVGTGTMIGRSSSWSSASITFALGAKCWRAG